jgi:hypothetical protein
VEKGPKDAAKAKRAFNFDEAAALLNNPKGRDQSRARALADPSTRT